MEVAQHILRPLSSAHKSPAAPSARIAPVLMTPEGEQALRRELTQLQDEVDVQLPDRLRQAREFGEAYGNDDYLQIREEQAVLAARIRSLSRILAVAKIVDPQVVFDGTATVGSTVTLRISGQIVQRRLLGSHEPIGADDMSVGSPVGRTILGRSAGETVLVELPSGETRSVEVLGVRSENAVET